MLKFKRILQLLICAGLLTTFLGCAASQNQESSGQYIDDAVITAKVKASIINETTLKLLQINVKTYKAVVQLSGFVDSSQSVTRAGELAQFTEGVQSVENDLIVK